MESNIMVPENEMVIVLKKMYASCDVENMNQVPVSVLIEFIKPYLQQDLSALETLKMHLDPENIDALISGETFSQIMYDWAKKVASYDGNCDREFNGIGTTIETRFHFSHSTPNASFEWENFKPVNFFDCSMLSNIPTKDNYTKDESLEEKINELREQMEAINSQLVITEFQNKLLQSDLTRHRIRLQNEQELNEYLKKDKTENEQLRRKVSFLNNQLIELTKKLQHYEKDNLYMRSFIHELEEEKAELISSYKDLQKREENLNFEVCSLETESDIKNSDHSITVNFNEELKVGLEHEKEVNEHLVKDNCSAQLESRLSLRYSPPYTFQSSYSNCSPSSQHYSFEDRVSFDGSTNVSFNIDQSKEEAAIVKEHDVNGSQKEENIRDLVQENKRIYLQLSETYKKFDELCKRLYEIKKKNQEFENLIDPCSVEKQELQNIIDPSSAQNQELENLIYSSSAEGAEKFKQLNGDCENLKIKAKLKEKELGDSKNKLNFEFAYKHIQTEFSLKTKELEEPHRLCKENTQKIASLSSINIDLGETLNEVNLELSQTGNKNEVLVLNNIYQETINQLNNDLKIKDCKVIQVEEKLGYEIKSKTDMQKVIEELKETNESLNAKIKEFNETREYNNILSNGISKNSDLHYQIYEKKNIILSKHQDEKSQNFNNFEQVNDSQEKIDEIRDNHIKMKEKSQIKNNDFETYETNLLQKAEQSLNEIKTLSFDKLKLTIEKLSQHIGILETELVKEKSKNRELEKQINLKTESNIMQNGAMTETQTLKKTVDELREQLLVQNEYYKELGKASNDKIKELSLNFAQLKEANQNMLFEFNEKNRISRDQLEDKSIIVNKLETNLKKVITQNQDLLQELKEKDVLVQDFREQIKKIQEANESLENQVNELSVKLVEQEQEVVVQNEHILKLGNEIQVKHDTIQDLKTSVNNLDTRLSQTFRKLLEKNDDFKAILSANKNLQQKLSKTDDSKEKERKEYESFRTKISQQANIIQNCCTNLYKALTVVIEKYGNELQKDAKTNVLLQLGDGLPTDIEDQLSCLKERVSIVIVLLEIFSSNASEIQHSLSNGDHKLIKTFTLGPTQNRGYNIFPNEASYGDSPNILTEYANNSSQQLLTDLEIFVPIIFHFDEAFPHLTDSFLKGFGLHENSAEQKLTQEEVDKMFTVFAEQLILDWAGVNDRLEKQKIHCQYLREKCFCLIKDISALLKNSKYVGTNSIVSPMLVLLEDLPRLLQEFVQSVGQLGILCCKSRMTKCWELTINYARNLKKELTKTKRYVSKELGEQINESAIEDKIKLKTKLLHTRGKATKYICHACSSILKKTATVFVFIIFWFFTTFAVMEWQCQINTDNTLCLMNGFVQKIYTGGAPY